MIFVTVGNSIKGVEFHRLIRKVDEIALDLKEEVVAQIGYIDDLPKNIRCFRYLDYDEILSYFEKASMIIGHCGVGTVINGLMYKKPIILVPRAKAYGEHIDDHQVELAEKLRDLHGIFVVEDTEELKTTILKVRALLEKKECEPAFSRERKRLLSFFREYVKECQTAFKQ